MNHRESLDDDVGVYWFLRVHRENLEHLVLRVAKGLLVESVYQEPPGQEEMPALRFVLSNAVISQLV